MKFEIIYIFLCSDQSSAWRTDTKQQNSISSRIIKYLTSKTKIYLMKGWMNVFAETKTNEEKGSLLKYFG